MGFPKTFGVYRGSVTLDPICVGRDVGQIADEVIVHLTSILGAVVRVTMHIEADILGGMATHAELTVTENSRNLNFEDSGFEKASKLGAAYGARPRALTMPTQ